MTVTFQLEGQEFIALNGGPHFKFTEAISLLVNCETQQEVDDSGSRSPPAERRASAAGSRTSTACPGRSSRPPSSRLMQDPDPARSKRVIEAMLQMKKIDIAGLEEAYSRK